MGYRIVVAGATEEGSASPPTDPMVDVPPVAPKPARAPSEKLDFMLSDARDAARRKGDVAADPAARATPPTPDATPEAPDCPMEPSV